MQLEHIRAVTWDGRESFAMIGVYVVDGSGRAVVGRDCRWQIPDDAIVCRRPYVEPAAPAPIEPALPSIAVEAEIEKKATRRR